MTFRVTMSDHDGVPVARKVAVDPSDEVAAERLAAEAANLASIRHRGLVELVAWDDRAVTTTFAGTPVRQSVSVTTPLAAAIAASLAHTVADLHDAGLTHGSITPSHVLVEKGAHPRLCSLGGLALASRDTEAADVAGVGEVLRHLVGDAGDADPIPEGRGPFRRRSARSERYERRALLTIADQATADDPAHRPAARRLAESIATTVPTATVERDHDAQIGVPRHLLAAARAEGPDQVPFPHPALHGLVVPDTPAALLDGAVPANGSDPTPAPPSKLGWVQGDRVGGDEEPPWPGDDDGDADDADEQPQQVESQLRRWPRPRAVGASVLAAIGATLIAAGGLGIIRAATPGSGDVETGAAPGPPPTPLATTTAPPTTAPASSTTVADAATAPEAVSCGVARSPDLDDDGCGDLIELRGSIVVVGDVRFRVGRDGDLVTLGDWDCDGVVTPALLRPATGDVFAFDEWTASRLSAAPLGRIEGAVTIRPDPEPTGCDRLVVEHVDGRRTTVPT